MIRVDPAHVATASPPPAGPGTDASAPARALIGRQLTMLTRLAEIGMEIAEAAGRQATQAAPAPAPADAAPLRDPALAYTRVARAVRMTIALQSRLIDDLAALDRSDDRAVAERASARRARLERLVELAVEAEPLSWEARERLEDADLEAEIEGVPFAEVVGRICRDLGLPPDRAARIVAAAGPDPGPSRPHPFAEPREAPAIPVLRSRQPP